jgi:hypothetical protein
MLIGLSYNQSRSKPIAQRGVLLAMVPTELRTQFIMVNVMEEGRRREKREH